MESGRLNQKLRTRERLVDVTLEMVRAGKTPSVAEVADAARVGRTTAYRYFPTPLALLSEALVLVVGEPKDRGLYAFFAECTEPAERLDAVVRLSHTSIRTHESEYRTLLRLSLDPEFESAKVVSRRPGYRRKWLVDALASIRPQLGKARFEALLNALSLTVGVECAVVLRDVCRLGHDAALEIKRQTAQTLLRSALREKA